jgi:Protein of unknown function, DUF547
MKKQFSIWIIGLLISNSLWSQSKPMNYVSVSTNLITALKHRTSCESQMEALKNCDLQILANQLATDEAKLTFWINVYNSFILNILQKNPSKYDDRRAFFAEKQINIGGQLFSFAEIEHGILRRSQHPFFMGYFQRPCVEDTEKLLRVSKRDYRIHFALNCGAKSCPPVSTLDIRTMDEQLNTITKFYLQKTTSIKSENAYNITALFSWFRGDFGGRDGIIKILETNGIIPYDNDPKLFTSEYDWTLDLDNFVK